jgi:uncharacterized protein
MDGVEEGPELSLLMGACQAPSSNDPLKMMLQHGANACLQTPCSRFTALHIAATRGDTDKCKLLLEADRRTLEIRARGGRSPLFEAVLAGQLPAVELLHKGYGANLFTVADNGFTLLHAALIAQLPSQPLLAYLIRSGLDVNAVDSIMQTPAHKAASQGNAAAVQLLLEHGADPNSRDSKSNTALQCACRLGHADVVEVLLNSGTQAVAPVTAQGHTVLMLAAGHKRAEVVQVLLLREADVLAVDEIGQIALHHAALVGDTDTAALLLQHGAAVNATDARGQSPLMCAAIADSASVMQLLLSTGADVQASSTQDGTVLLYCAANASEQCMQLLLDAGADVSELIYSGSTVLHAAAVNEAHPQVLQLLLQHTAAMAHINSTAEHCECCGSSTPLTWCKHPATVKLVLAAGADVHMTTDTGNTCLHVAAAHSYPASVVCLLIKAGVNLHALNSEGKTAAQVASESGNTLTASLLTRAAAGP